MRRGFEQVSLRQPPIAIGITSSDGNGTRSSDRAPLASAPRFRPRSFPNLRAGRVASSQGSCGVTSARRRSLVPRGGLAVAARDGPVGLRPQGGCRRSACSAPTLPSAKSRSGCSVATTPCPRGCARVRRLSRYSPSLPVLEAQLFTYVDSPPPARPETPPCSASSPRQRRRHPRASHRDPGLGFAYWRRVSACDSTSRTGRRADSAANVRLA
jgi:hypothetical protein